MITKGLRAQIARNIYRSGYELYLFQRVEHPEPGAQFVTDMTMTFVPECSTISDSSAILLSPESAQELLDELYRAGIRPSRDVSDRGAQDMHLADMRKIVGKQLGVDL